MTGWYTAGDTSFLFIIIPRLLWFSSCNFFYHLLVQSRAAEFFILGIRYVGGLCARHVWMENMMFCKCFTLGAYNKNISSCQKSSWLMTLDGNAFGGEGRATTIFATSLRRHTLNSISSYLNKRWECARMFFLLFFHIFFFIFVVVVVAAVKINKDKCMRCSFFFRCVSCLLHGNFFLFSKNYSNERDIWIFILFCIHTFLCFQPLLFTFIHFSFSFIIFISFFIFFFHLYV